MRIYLHTQESLHPAIESEYFVHRNEALQYILQLVTHTTLERPVRHSQRDSLVNMAWPCTQYKVPMVCVQSQSFHGVVWCRSTLFPMLPSWGFLPGTWVKFLIWGSGKVPFDVCLGDRLERVKLYLSKWPDGTDVWEINCSPQNHSW